MKLYGIKNITKYLGISRTTFRTYIKNNKLPLKKLGGKYVINSERLDEYINSLLKIKE